MSTATVVTDLPTGVWSVDPIHSFVSFRVGHMGVGTYRATFGQVDATYDGSGRMLRGEVPVESIDVSLPPMRGALLAAPFFDAERHPKMTFESTSIAVDDDGRLTVTGELTINGVTKQVVARGTATSPAEDMQGEQRFGLELSATIDRRDFGVTWNADIPGGNLAVDWDVTLDVSLELTEAAGD